MAENFNDSIERKKPLIPPSPKPPKPDVDPPVKKPIIPNTKPSKPMLND